MADVLSGGRKPRFFAGPEGPRFNSVVPDTIEHAATGRARCRGCGEVIAKGELRFGESLPNAYREGEALYWFHLHCAACMRPDKAAAAIEAFTEDVPEREIYRHWTTLGTQHHRLPRILRAERATSGRAKCRHCREVIEKGALRIALQMMEESRMTPIGFIHVTCAGGYFGTTNVLDRIVRLTRDLTPEDEVELTELLARSVVPEPDAAQTTDAVDAGAADAPGANEKPGLAKTHGEASAVAAATQAEPAKTTR